MERTVGEKNTTHPDTQRERFVILLQHMRKHWGTLCIGLLLALLSTSVSLAIPLATKSVLDSVATDGFPIGSATLLLTLLATGTIASLIQSLLLGRLAEHVVLDARRTLIQRFLSSRIEHVQGFQTGELVTRVTSDTVLMRSATSFTIVQFANGTVSLIGTITLMAWLDWQLLLVTLTSVLLIGAVFAALLPRIGQAARQTQAAIGELGSGLESRLRAIRTVKSCRAERREIARLGTYAEASANHAMRSVWYSGLIDAAASGGTQLALIVVLGLGAWRVSTGDLAASTLVAFLLYALNIVDPIITLGNAFTSLETGLAAAARINETGFMSPEESTTPTNRSKRSSASPAIALRNVTAQYHSAAEPTLAEVTLEIPSFGHTAIVGPSGAGKTTIFSLLLRFIEPTGGHLELDGCPYNEFSIEYIRSQFAYVEQEPPIIPGTVRDNLLFRDENATDDEAWAALEAVLLANQIRLLPDGLDSEISETAMSGGERQRLAVARALIRTPNILLLDEATAQLDGITEAAIQHVIKNLSTTGPVITIAHRLSTVLGANQIIVLDQGRIRAIGTHHELLTSDEVYRKFISALKIQTG